MNSGGIALETAFEIVGHPHFFRVQLGFLI